LVVFIVRILIMTRQNKGARGQLKSGRRTISPFGVGHRLIRTDELNDFFSDLEAEAKALPNVEFRDEAGRLTKEKRPVIFFNPQRLRLRVVERSLTEKIGKANRFRWTAGDKARIQQSVVDEVGRFDVGGRIILAQMSIVPSLGDAELANAGYHSVSIGPSAESAEALLFAREHEIAVNGLRRRQHKQHLDRDVDLRKVVPDPYTPHISIGRVVHGTPPELHTKVIELVQRHLPLDVQLNPLEFTPKEWEQA
jgi:hypothetical protein